MMKKNILLFALLLFPGFLAAQALKPQVVRSSADIRLMLRKMNELSTVLYVAAHPDDENTRMISYLAGKEKVRTAYLSFTRGDGGQNLIGSEIGPYLGIIRTQELLQARQIDGGEQYFSRANDFGYSKNAEETLEIWDKQKLIKDAVRIIRKLRPDVMITRFDPESSGKTHGHHTTSAILGLAAYRAAGLPDKYPDLTAEGLAPWQPKRIVWNTSSWFFRNGGFDPAKYVKVPAGSYDPLTGKSYGEIASDSRSMHQSQGMGSTKNRSLQPEYFAHLDGEKADNQLFEGVHRSWKRIPDGEKVAKLFTEALKNFDDENPGKTVEILLRARKEIVKLQQKNKAFSVRLSYKLNRTDELIRACSGLWFEAVSDEPYFTAGEAISLSLKFVKRQEIPVKLKSLEFPFSSEKPIVSADSVLKNEIQSLIKISVPVKANLDNSQPYWLEQAADKGMFNVEKEHLIGNPENPTSASVRFVFEIAGEEITYEIPVMHRRTDRVRGEIYCRVYALPAATANIDEPVYVFGNNKAKELKIRVKSGSKQTKGKLTLDLPEGWKAEPAGFEFDFSARNDETVFAFKLSPPAGSSVAEARVLIDGKPAAGRIEINHSHIPSQIIFPPASVRLVKLDINVLAKKIGYYEGAGDEIPACLRQIGCEVVVLTDEIMESGDLARFDAIITGIRSYNMRERIGFHNRKFLEYAKNGGNLIVQFNISRGLITSDIGPYPFKINRTRITKEEAPFRFALAEHPVLNVPNKIGQKDFDGWVQERGVYFAENPDPKYESPLVGNDPGEAETGGGLIFARYGKGSFVYTGLAFFRQLPAGVPGAYRLFANLISYKSEEK